MELILCTYINIKVSTSWHYCFWWLDMYKVPKIGSWKYFCNILRKSVATAFVFYCDAKYSDILRGSSHVCCCLFQTMQLKVENCMLLIIYFVLLQPHTARENVGRKALGNFKHFLFILWTENGLRNKIVWLFEIRLAFVEHCRSYVKNIHEKEFKIQNIYSD